MVLTLKKWLDNKLDHELKYIISFQRVIVAYNVTHLLEWCINLILLQI
jgi:hypothetical protein